MDETGATETSASSEGDGVGDDGTDGDGDIDSDSDTGSDGDGVCGDGVIDPDEECDDGDDDNTNDCTNEDCDGDNLDAQTCMSQGYLGGPLTCAPECLFDLAACNAEPRLLLSQGATLQERKLDGTLLDSVMVPLMDGTEAELRELTHHAGVTYVYRGTFSPTLTYYDDDLLNWVHEPFLGWSTVNNVSYGGLAHTDDWIWATDMSTVGGPEVGLVRFSLLDMTKERVQDTTAYIDVFAGDDGLVYALRGNGSTLDAIDPADGQLLDTIALDADVRAIAVDADSMIYGASWDGALYLFDNLGGQLQQVGAGISSLVDVDVAVDGMAAVGGRFGDVVVLNPALDDIVASFNAGPDETFLEFLEPG